MNTASAVIDGSIASPKFGKMRITSTSMTFEAWIPSEIEAISPLVDWLMQLIERSRCAAGNESAVELALREALNNAVLHGNGMDTHKLVEVCCRCERGKGVWLIVKDQGNGFDPHAVPDALAPDRLEAEHGRGICLMRSSMDQVLFERGGTEVRMWKGPAVRRWRRKASQWRSKIKRLASSGMAEKEENCMKLVPMFVVAAVIVACLKGIKRDRKDESVSSFHRLGL